MTQPFSSWAGGAFAAFAAKNTPGLGECRLSAVGDPSLILTCKLGDTRNTGPTGFATWDALSKPTASTFAGVAPLTIPIPLIISGFRGQRSIEPQVRVLKKMMGLDLADGERPPTLIIEGRGIQHAYHEDPSRRWVLSGDPSWDETRRLDSGPLTLVRVTVSAVAVDHPETLPNPATAKRVTFTIPGDGTKWTGARVAKTHGVSWRALRKLNPTLKADDSKTLKKGLTVRVA